LTADLCDQTGHIVANGCPVTSNSGHLWIMRFDNFPVGNHYLLQVKHGSTVLGSVGDLSFPLDIRDDIDLWSPTDDDNPVGTDFLTYGRTVLTNELTPHLVDPTTSDEVETWSKLFGPPDSTPDWAFEYSDVPVKNGYTLYITGNSSESRSQNVDVQ
jgi:hypothetical protein